jgi:voltage-gated potassium channel
MDTPRPPMHTDLMRRVPIAPAVMKKTWLVLAKRTGQLVLGMVIGFVLLFLSGILFWVVERDGSPEVDTMFSGLKWVSLTLLQQSSPWAVTTAAGTALYYFVLVIGVGIVAMGTGAIASKLVEYVIRKGSGMGEAKVSGHIVICGWSSKGQEILRELHAEEVEDKRPVVILAPLESTPTRDELTTFIRGHATSNEDLLRAGIDRADTAIILADQTNGSTSSDDMDARTLLTTLAVESVNPNCYTCVEVIRSENRVHFERTKADELVVSAELTGALLASSAVTHGLSRLVTDLITHPEGNELYYIPVPAALAGASFADAMVSLKRDHDCVLVAVASGDGEYRLNPPGDERVDASDRLLVIAGREITGLPVSQPSARARA